MSCNVPVAEAISDEAMLPERVQEALGQLLGAAKEGLLALSVEVGLGVLHELLELEVDEVVGPKGIRTFRCTSDLRTGFRSSTRARRSRAGSRRSASANRFSSASHRAGSVSSSSAPSCPFAAAISARRTLS